MAIPVSSGLAIAIGFMISGFGMGFASPALFPAALSDDEGREGRDTSAVTTARQLGAGIGAALAGFVLIETVPEAVLRAAEDGESPLPQLHDAAGLAFGLLGLDRAAVAARDARHPPDAAPFALSRRGRSGGRDVSGT